MELGLHVGARGKFHGRLPEKRACALRVWQRSAVVVNGLVDLYINQIYGDTDLYECNEDFINNKNISSLQNPIISCKDKLSIFNRIIAFNDKKLISGYISHNSYFDIYLNKLDISENIDDDQKIKISSLGKGINIALQKI